MFFVGPSFMNQDFILEDEMRGESTTPPKLAMFEMKGFIYSLYMYSLACQWLIGGKGL